MRDLITVYSDGQSVDSQYQIISLDVVKQINRIPYAELVLADGDLTQKVFSASNAEAFAIGKTLELKIISAEQSDEARTVFSGLIVKHTIKAERRKSYLTLELKNPAVKLTYGKHSQVYDAQSDSDIINSLLEQQGLSAGKLTATAITHASMVQHNVSAWDFMLARAAANGLWLIADDSIDLIQPQLAAAQASYEYGVSAIDEFEMTIDGNQQYSSIEAKGWSVADQAIVSVNNSQTFELAQGAISPDSTTLTCNSYQLVNYSDLPEAELTAWANAKMQNYRLAYIRGYLMVEGTANIKLGDTIKLIGFSQGFAGNTLVTGIRHFLSVQQQWVTTLQFGLPVDGVYPAQTLNQLVPAISGLQIGIVQSFEEDPDNKYRLKVKVPALGNDENNIIFARLASPYATQEGGFCFVPEEGDEVVLSFLNDDPRQPVILGSLYNPVNVPVLPFTADNQQKGIIIKSAAQKIIFDAEAQSITLTNSDNTQVLVNEDDGVIVTASALGLNGGDSSLIIDDDINLSPNGQVQISGNKLDVQTSTAISGNLEVG